jgi:hypothetical protein
MNVRHGQGSLAFKNRGELSRVFFECRIRPKRLAQASQSGEVRSLGESNLNLSSQCQWSGGAELGRLSDSYDGCGDCSPPNSATRDDVVKSGTGGQRIVACFVRNDVVAAFENYACNPVDRNLVVVSSDG